MTNSCLVQPEAPALLSTSELTFELIADAELVGLNSLQTCLTAKCFTNRQSYTSTASWPANSFASSANVVLLGLRPSVTMMACLTIRDM